MDRFIDKYLREWKQSTNRKPLILRGARQVGKTYSVNFFARKNYKYYLKINLEQDAQLKSIFDDNNPQQIINNLTALYQIPLIDNESLLFIDEIQLAPKAILSLRYFYEQKPDLHIITAGSLLDHVLNDIQYSMPVGRVEFAYMFPLSFIEFLMAQNEKGLVKQIESFKIEKPLNPAIHKKICEYLRLYFFIGGMPEAVNAYVQTKNLVEVEKVHSSILTSFEYDFSKYGTKKQQEILNDVLLYCANNIGRKVKYMNINKNVNSNLLKDAFIKLEMSRIIHLVRNTKSTIVPITQYQDNDVYKPLFMDIGLVCHLARIRLIDLNNLETDFEGSLAEQFVGQEFITNSAFYNETKLNYWTREMKNSNAEIDYLYQIKNNIFPIEVKAGKRGTLRSLHVFLTEKSKKTGIRFNLDLPSFGKDLEANVNLPDKKQLKYNLLSLPLYFAGQLRYFDIKE